MRNRRILAEAERGAVERSLVVARQLGFSEGTGDLAAVSTYMVDVVDSLALANSLTDSSVPANGAGFFYLVRPRCPLGSWQTSLGAEPGRDEALP